MSTVGSFLHLEMEDTLMMNSVAMLANAGIEDQLKHTEKVHDAKNEMQRRRGSLSELP